MIICNLSPWMHANALSSAMSKNHVIDKAESAEFLTLPKPPLPTCWRSQNSPRAWVEVNPPNGLCLVSKPSILGSTKANFLALIHPFCGVWSFWLIATSTYRHISICVPSRSSEHPSCQANGEFQVMDCRHMFLSSDFPMAVLRKMRGNQLPRDAQEDLLRHMTGGFTAQNCDWRLQDRIKNGIWMDMAKNGIWMDMAMAA